MFLSLVLVFLFFLNSENLYAQKNFHGSAAQINKIYNYQKLQNRSVEKKLRINPKKPWNGHFSAINFSAPEEKIKLMEIKKALRSIILSLPAAHTEVLKKLEVRNGKNIKIKNYTPRGISDSRQIILNVNLIKNTQELIAIMVHEMGHIIDMGFFQGKNKKISNFWDNKTPIYTDDKSLDFYNISWVNSYKIKPNISRADFVSGYSMTDCFEDFAESYIFYRLHGEKFRVLMQDSEILRKKYFFLKNNVFAHKEFQLDKKINKVQKNIWDATLLDF